MSKALEIIKYKDLFKWVDIRKYLKEALELLYSASSLELKINSIKMNHGKSVNSYTDRVKKKLFFKLCLIYTLNKSEAEAKIIREQLKEQTFALYIKELNKPIKVMFNVRNPKTIEKAKSIPNTEELEFNPEEETQNIFNTNKYYNNISTNSKL